MLISLTTSFVALVAGLGIANTLLMSVLEHTHEIGVMKAVGARDRHIQMLFLGEGALIGLLGSGVGLLRITLAAWLDVDTRRREPARYFLWGSASPSGFFSCSGS